LLVLAVIQVGLVVRDQVLIIHAAREAARSGAVDPRPGVARSAALHASGLDDGSLTLDLRTAGTDVTVAISYKSVTNVPIVGPLVPDLVLHARLAMRSER
jgi:hypothetical protein